MSKRPATLTSEEAADHVAEYLAKGKTIEQLPGFGDPGRVRPEPIKATKRQKRGPSIVLGSHPWNTQAS